ncbi:hypothetical protein MPSEU_000953200 [Mayamaea pseudoterrestris]|nr:hypothetical protein MPSEU_000953200 [Mayamaea pseudoterrestris]
MFQGRYQMLRALQINNASLSTARLYSSTPVTLEGDAAAAKLQTEEQITQRHKIKLASLDYNQRRASYKRQVSALRIEYAKEIARQRASDKAEQEALQKELTRRRLERQFQKNTQTAKNMLRQKELREQRAKEFQEHLELMQLERDAKNERFQKARQLVVDELEQEAPLWLTTAEEVEAAFTPEAEQLLWARPNGVLGAPNPSLDCHFWQQETHTWLMRRTYKSQRQVLLDELEDIAYNEANIDESFWTQERLQELEQLEDKARLRAMVRSIGRISLLRRQKELLEEQYVTAEGEVPKPMPVPNFQMLQNEAALEKEGAQILLEDPTKFFVFEGSTASASDRRQEQNDEISTYVGPTLGSPIALRDPLREHSHQGTVFPQIIGKIPKPDDRTEREKKLQEREERMWAAAQAEKMGDMDIELAAQQQTAEDLEPDINYDEFTFDFGDEDWAKGLDPIADEHVLRTPHEKRYKEEDIDWVVDKLASQVKHLEQQFVQDMTSLKRTFESELRQTEGHEIADMPVGSIEAALLSLSDAELLALSDLDDRCGGKVSDEDLNDAEKVIPGLSREQIKQVLTRDETAST